MNRLCMRTLLMTAVLALLVSCGGGGGGGGDGSDGGGGGGGGTPGTDGGGTAPTPASAWVTRRAGIPRPVNAVARSTTKFVAVIDDGTAATSSDGYSWGTPVTTGLFSFNDVVWGNGQFVATGSFGYIATSPDGVAWTKRSECPGICTDELTSIAWSGSRYVAAGEGGRILTSADGTVWSAATTTFPSNATFRSVATNGSLFTAVSYDGNALKGMIVHSSDGMVWSRATITPETGYEFDRVIWDGSRFLATAWGSVPPAGIWTSATGTSWTKLTTDLVSKITSTGGGYVATNGVGRISTSADAVTWTTGYDFVYSGINDIVWMPDRNEYLVAGGMPGTDGFIATSADLSTWDMRSSSHEITSVLWNGAEFLAIDANGRLFTSADGLSWGSNRMIPPDGILRTYRDIAWSGSRYVAVTYEKIVSSPDGITWGNPYYWSLGSFVSVVWTGSEFAAITYDGKFFRSNDGITWPAPADVVTVDIKLTDLAWADGIGYAAVTADEDIHTSPTGSVWTPYVSVAPAALQAVAWNGSHFAAVGNSGTIMTSPNGSDWTDRSIAGGPNFTDVAWTGSQFIAASSSGKVYVSSDGASWSQETTDTTKGLSKIAASATRAVIVGKEGRILSRP